MMNADENEKDKNQETKGHDVANVCVVVYVDCIEIAHKKWIQNRIQE